MWPWLLQRCIRWRLRREYGVGHVECHGGEQLKACLKAGDGVLLAPNHCRPCDPDVIFEMGRQLGVLPFTVASWHLFMQSRFQTFLLRRVGAFSIYREGVDRAAINASIDTLASGNRPLVIFPEGAITRTNDRLNQLQEGTAFIARSAVKKRAKSNGAGRVVVIPVAIRYHYDGDVRQAVTPTLTEIESRLSWRPQVSLSLEQRVEKLGKALLTLKEVEYLGGPQTGSVDQRVQQLIDAILEPLEREWLNGKRDSHVVGRVKNLRAAVLPDMIQSEMSEAERQRRWLQLADMYLAQQLSCYPPEYLADRPTPERWLETVERFEEDLTDRCRSYPPLRAVVTLGQEIPVSAARDRGAVEDPLMAEIGKQLKQMLGIPS